MNYLTVLQEKGDRFYSVSFFLLLFDEGIFTEDRGFAAAAFRNCSLEVCV